MAGVAASAFLGLVVGLVAIRRQGIYFAMITLALAQMVYFICLQAPFTGGEDGLQGVPRGKLFGVLPLASDTTMYYVVAVIFVACFLGIRRIVHLAVRPGAQDDPRERASRHLAGLRGRPLQAAGLRAVGRRCPGWRASLKTLVMGFATLSDVHWSMSGEVILMSLLGGVGTFFGPVFGAGIVIALQDMLADKVGAWVTVIIGAIFVVCVLAFRKGVVGELRRLHGTASGPGFDVKRVRTPR